MSRAKKPARLWLQQARYDKEGRLRKQAVWLILDGGAQISTGCGEREIENAERALAEHVKEKRPISRKRDSDADQVLIADIISLYSDDIAPKRNAPKEIAARLLRLNEFFGAHTLSDLNGQLCRDYAATRPQYAARRELEDLRSAINYHRKEGYCRHVVDVTLPDKAVPRDRWLTRKEAAKILSSAWQYREVQKGKPTGRRSRKHVAKFVLVGLYTGTRATPICQAAFYPFRGTGYVDVERGIYYRKPSGVADPKNKKRPPIRLPNRLLAHLKRWKEAGQTYVVEFNKEPIKKINKAFCNSVAAAKLDARLGKVTPHTLRHTAATWLMQNGCDLWEAAGYLGMTVEVLEDVYGHHHPAHQEGAREAITARPRNSTASVRANEWPMNGAQNNPKWVAGSNSATPTSKNIVQPGDIRYLSETPQRRRFNGR